jgi:hypothetical protein
MELSQDTPWFWEVSRANIWYDDEGVIELAQDSLFLGLGGVRVVEIAQYTGTLSR